MKTGPHVLAEAALLSFENQNRDFAGPSRWFDIDQGQAVPGGQGLLDGRANPGQGQAWERP